MKNIQSLFSVTELSLPGVLLITPSLFKDGRGFFVETYNEQAFAHCGITARFVQDNLSYSTHKVLRGLHRQLEPHAQDKLVRCARGEIFDVAADVDSVSSTYGKHISVTLSAENGNMLFIPGRYAHGFCVLSIEALVEYKVTDVYTPEAATGVRFDDPVLGISWPITDPILSEQDRNWPSL